MYLTYQPKLPEAIKGLKKVKNARKSLRGERMMLREKITNQI